MIKNKTTREEVWSIMGEIAIHGGDARKVEGLAGKYALIDEEILLKWWKILDGIYSSGMKPTTLEDLERRLKKLEDYTDIYG